jgi:hypothetical protein
MTVAFSEIQGRLRSEVYEPLIADLLLWRLLEKRTVGGREYLFPVRLVDQVKSIIGGIPKGKDPDDAGQVCADNVFRRMGFPDGLYVDMICFSQDSSGDYQQRLLVCNVLNALYNLDSARGQEELRVPSMLGFTMPKIWAYPKKLATMMLYQELQKFFL